MAQNDFLPISDENKNFALEKEILDIVEVNSFSKNILAAYKVSKIANKVSKQQYGYSNYKEYVEMIMIKNFPIKLEKVLLGSKYYCYHKSLFFVFPIIFCIKYCKKLNKLYE